MKMNSASLRQLVRAAVVLTATLCAGFGAAQEKSKTGSAFTEDEVKKFIDFHNEKRAEVKNPGLVWSSELAAFAQAWADHIAENGKVQHRPRTGEFKQKYGENIAAGAKFGPLEGAAGWYSEKKAFDAGKNKLPENLSAVGHYTQMVWKTTTKVGAGKAVIQKGNTKGWTVIVGNYDPPGNGGGKKPF